MKLSAYSVKYNILRLDLPCYCVQVVDAKTGQEVNEETEAAGEWVDEYEKFRATEADEWGQGNLHQQQMYKRYLGNSLNVGMIISTKFHCPGIQRHIREFL